jgi:hypothetical protein
VLVCDVVAGAPREIELLLFEEVVRGRGHVSAGLPGPVWSSASCAASHGSDARHERPADSGGSVFGLRLPHVAD